MERQRLPSDVKPSHYKLDLYNLKYQQPFSYQGTVKIDVTVNQPTNTIWLNSKELEILKATVTFNNTSLECIQFRHDEELERIELQFPSAVSGPEASITIQFSGTINNTLAGFYRSSMHQNPSAPEHHVFSTQFESCEARKAFPCFDEPSLKATFDFSIQVPEHLTALSNMPIKNSISNSDGTKVVSFERTPVMSTYLAAWAVGDFEHIEAVTEQKHDGKHIDVRVYTPKGLISQAEYALHHTCRVLDYFATIFKADYPLPKMDLVVIPEFAHGAMENWGLCTFQTTALLYDKETSTLDNQERASYVIAHELAHQWFGNLVTMDWWNDLWLNEGFATWAGWLAVDHFHPDWNVWGKFLCEGLQKAFQLDSLRASHPIHVHIKNGPDIDSIFDDISYLKGSSLVRMLDSYLGQDVFLNGVASYLNAFKYRNALSTDLWDHLSKESGKDVGKFMNGWIHQMGFPMVSIDVKQDQVRISQERLLLTNDTSSAEKEVSWWVPLDLSQFPGNDVEAMQEKSLDVKLAPDQQDLTSLTKLNKNQTGFYRVNYSSELLETLTKNPGALASQQKSSLVADVTALAVAGQKSVTDLLLLLSSLRSYKDYFVWVQVSRALDLLSSTFSDDPALAHGLGVFSSRLLEEITPTVEWEIKSEEGHLTNKMRAVIIKLAGSAGNKDITARALQDFEAYTSGNAPLHSSVLPTILFMACSRGDASQYHAIKSLYLKAPSTAIDLKETCIRALALTPLQETLDDYFSFLLSDNVQVPDFPLAGAALSGQPLSRTAFWAWLKENWDDILRKFDKSWPLLDKFFRQAFSGFTDEASEEEVREFFKQRDHEKIGFARGLEIVVEKMRVNAQFKERNQVALREWLAEGSHSA